MTNIHSLDVTGMLFHTEKDHQKFNNVVSESLSTLRQLQYLSIYPGSRKFYRPGQEKHAVLRISGLQEITWNEPDAFIRPLHILNPINASRESLTHIRILEPHNWFFDTDEHLIHFFTLRFPHLSTLQLGGWNTMTHVGAAFTNFLVAHPLLEDLDLGFSDHFRGRVHCHLSPDVTLAPGILPNLRRLTVDAFNLSIFVPNRISSLQTLESLHIGVGCFEEQQDNIGFAEMCRALEVYGGLPGLRVLELELQSLSNELENASWIAGLGKQCPNLERFWGDYEVGVASAVAQDIFASCTKLKSLTLPDADRSGLWGGDRMGHVKQILAHNPSVTDLRFYEPSDVDIIRVHYRMERDTNGGITTMVIVLEDGTEIIWI